MTSMLKKAQSLVLKSQDAVISWPVYAILFTRPEAIKLWLHLNVIWKRHMLI